MARIIADSVDIPSAGSAVQLSSVGEHVLSITFKGTALNKGLVYIGDITVAAAVGLSLEPGESIPLPAALFMQETGDPHTVLLSDIYIDAANSGDDIEYVAMVTG